MKRMLIALMILTSAGMISGQDLANQVQPADPFARMISKMLNLESISFRSELREKNIFEDDTSSSFARITLKKTGTEIEMLNIIPEEGEKELLFCSDSSWIVDHMGETMILMGTSINSLKNNSISNFFPFSVYELDSGVFKVDPFWHIVSRDDSNTMIDLEIRQQSPELSNVRVCFSINNELGLLSGTLQEYTYLNVGQGFEKLIISDYAFPRPLEINIPEYYSIYGKDLSICNQQETNPGKSNQETEIYLVDIELFDMDGKKYLLPQDGLSFFDLWYAGCAPCIKSAPVIEKIQKIYDDELYFYSVNELDSDNKKILQFKDKMGLTMPVLKGEHGKLAATITRGGGYPLFFLMDNISRKVLWHHTGYSDDLEKIIIESISKYL